MECCAAISEKEVIKFALYLDIYGEYYAELNESEKEGQRELSYSFVGY